MTENSSLLDEWLQKKGFYAFKEPLRTILSINDLNDIVNNSSLTKNDIIQFVQDCRQSQNSSVIPRVLCLKFQLEFWNFVESERKKFRMNNLTSNRKPFGSSNMRLRRNTYSVAPSTSNSVAFKKNVIVANNTTNTNDSKSATNESNASESGIDNDCKTDSETKQEKLKVAETGQLKLNENENEARIEKERNDENEKKMNDKANDTSVAKIEDSGEKEDSKLESGNDENEQNKENENDNEKENSKEKEKETIDHTHVSTNAMIMEHDKHENIGIKHEREKTSHSFTMGSISNKKAMFEQETKTRSTDSSNKPVKKTKFGASRLAFLQNLENKSFVHNKEQEMPGRRNRSQTYSFDPQRMSMASGFNYKNGGLGNLINKITNGQSNDNTNDNKDDNNDDNSGETEKDVVSPLIERPVIPGASGDGSNAPKRRPRTRSLIIE